jgi:hypothetical protein
MFSVVSPVLSSRIPVVAKLVVRLAAMEPPKVHIHHFAPARDNSMVSNSCSCGVICLGRVFWLEPTHIDEGLMASIISCAMMKMQQVWIRQQKPSQT